MTSRAQLIEEAKTCPYKGWAWHPSSDALHKSGVPLVVLVFGTPVAGMQVDYSCAIANKTDYAVKRSGIPTIVEAITLIEMGVIT